MSSGSPAGFVTRNSWAIGTIGTVTPASAAISRANMPPALTTISVSTSPLSVSTPATRPVLDAEARNARLLGDLRAAAAGALGQRVREL